MTVIRIQIPASVEILSSVKKALYRLAVKDLDEIIAKNIVVLSFL